jgi:CRP-like cAMP-binding protein
MRRAQVHARLVEPAVAAAVGKCCATEAQNSDNMMAALGQCSADERIAHLFLHLMRRVAGRTLDRGRCYPCPLRHQHIADAVGLTTVHVSRVLGGFRERGIAELSRGGLEVRNVGELRRLGALS